jgi:hypothetical protein
MLSLAIVKDFDVLETEGFHGGMGGIAHAMNAFVPETVEPAFRRCIISAIAFATHRTHHFVGTQFFLEGATGVLAGFNRSSQH